MAWPPGAQAHAQGSAKGAARLGPEPTLVMAMVAAATEVMGAEAMDSTGSSNRTTPQGGQLAVYPEALAQITLGPEGQAGKVGYLRQ